MNLRTTLTPKATGRRGGRLAVAAIAGMLFLVIGGSPAGADTATATAAGLRLAGTAVPGVASASNDGTVATVSDGGGTPSVLPANPVLGAGAIGQLAVARNNGTSASCAGLIAPSSVITISPNGTCDPGSTNSGVTLNLGNALVVNAGAITAECTGSSTGAPTGRSRIANGQVTLAGLPLLTLNANASPNSSVGLNGILSIDLNTQTTSGGVLTVTAFRVTLLNGSLVEIGQVSCGPNTVTGAIPLVPAAGYPIAAAVLLAGGGALAIHRKRTSGAPLAA